MEKVVPYRTVSGAKAALDNGGRLYNLLSRAHDNRITRGELAKAAGVLLVQAKAMLFLHMALTDLTEAERWEVLAMLDRPMSRRYHSQLPRRLAPSAISTQGKEGDVVLVEGLPQFATRAVQTTETPMFDGEFGYSTSTSVHYDLYHLSPKGHASKTPPALLLDRWSRRPDKGPARFGGILRSLKFDGGVGNKAGVYLEPLYFTPLDG